MPATICFVIIGLDYAGAEIQLVEVIRRLRVRGWRMFVVSLLTPAAFVRELSMCGVEVVSLHLEKGEPLRLPLLLRFLAEVRRIRPDIIHGHMVHSNLLARLAAVTLGIPVAVATVHSTFEGGTARMWLYRLTERWGSVTTSVSEAGRERHLEKRASSEDRILVLPNGIDQERFRPMRAARERIRREQSCPEERFVWLTVTRLAPPKDPNTLLRAMTTLPEHVDLWIVGQGSDLAQTEATVDALALRHRVRFLGVRADIPDLLSAADAFVLSSRAEAMPISLLEAASACLPCVASDVGAVRELVSDRQTGFVVPPSDAEVMGQAMAEVVRMTGPERAAMGERGRSLVSRYGLEATVDRWEALYREHLQAHSPKET